MVSDIWNEDGLPGRALPGESYPGHFLLWKIAEPNLFLLGLYAAPRSQCETGAVGIQQVDSAN